MKSRDKLGRFVGKNKENFICKFCGKDFLNYASNKPKFCCVECYYEWEKNNSKGNKNNFFGKTHTKKIKKLISNNNFKTPISERLIKKCEICNKNIKKSKKQSWKTYKTHRFCSMLCHHKYYCGNKSNFWDNGKSFEKYPKEFNKQFKKKIRIRDKHKCMKCGIHQKKLSRTLDVHHINYNKKITTPRNCCTLCQKCNAEVNTNRKYWTKFFQSSLLKRYNYKYFKVNDILRIINLKI